MENLKKINKAIGDIDRWKHLRGNLFGNIEPHVELTAISKPTGFYDSIEQVFKMSSEVLPGYTARASHESNDMSNYESDIELNKKLLKWHHDTPFESLTYTFLVTGISKSLGGQWTRHRAGIGWTFRSTRYIDARSNNFVYPALEYIDDEQKVFCILEEYEQHHRDTVDGFEYLVDHCVVNKQEARRIMPVGFATSCYCYTNARALREFFKLRLAPHAEWEIRRLANILMKLVYTNAPSVYEDLI